MTAMVGSGKQSGRAVNKILWKQHDPERWL